MGAAAAAVEPGLQMPRLMLLLQVVAGILVAASGFSVEVRLRPNGARWDELSTAFSADSMEGLRKEVDSSNFVGLGDKWWLADSDGFTVETWEQVTGLPEEQRTFSIVPAGKLFQWGPRAVGERFPLKMEGLQGVELETVAASPRVFLIHNLFAEKEALFLIERAGHRTGENALAKSGTGFKTTGARDRTYTRTSSNAFDADSSMAKALMMRCFEALRIPFSTAMADGLQILKYSEGEAYISHTDWFAVNAADGYNFDSTTPGGSNRYATVFLYLWPPPSGGYTVFPKATVEADLRDSDFISTGRNQSLLDQALVQARSFYKDSTWQIDLTKECFTSLGVKPVRLGAALFYHQEPMTGRLLIEATHGACPSMSGTKWGANLWIWNQDRHLTGKGKEATPLKPVQVVFANLEAMALDVGFSMDDGDTWTIFQSLDVGKTTTAKSYPGHTWRFTLPNGGDELRRWSVPPGLTEAQFGSRETIDHVPAKHKVVDEL